MKLIRHPEELRKYLKTEKSGGKRSGFVPTMGALHDGHLSLIEASKKDNNLTIASIFVNPLQFNNPSDLTLYPRTLETDIQKLESSGCDILFCPSESDVYSQTPKMKISFGRLEEVMEGRFRPGHFNGVAIVVSKLFHFVQPDMAYFGQKDLQQFLIIKQMVQDLSFPLELQSCPIFREADGLAMSSRNVRIPKEKREVAANIYKALKLGAEEVPKNGVEIAKQKVIHFIDGFKDLKIEYFEIADGETLEPVKNVNEHKQVALCIAVYLEGVRLIDNILLFS